MPNDDLADALEELAALLRHSKADRFRVRAYERAARVVRAIPIDIGTLDASEIGRLQGIGAALARLIAEFTATGTMRLLDDARAAEPAGFGVLLGLPLIGVRDARTLAGQGFGDVESLRGAVARPDAADLLGDRLLHRVRESLRRRDTAVDHRLPLPFARRDAATIAQALHDVEGVEEVVVAGATRRCADTVESFSFVIVGDPPALPDLASSRAIVRVLSREQHLARVLTTTGRPATTWLAPPATAGAALVHATGSTSHVAVLRRRAADRGMILTPTGLQRDGRVLDTATEAAVYDAVGLAEVPAELREDTGEIAAAAEQRLPALVRAEDLRGDLHVHTDYSGDGKAPLEAMVAAARSRGYAYVALTDHTENLSINGMPREKVLARRRVIGEVQQQHADIRILDAAELNIGLDGGLDYDLDFLLTFDVAVASIHSHMDRPIGVQTDRILKAIEHPAVTVIGHPTGRILGHRPAYGIEMTAIAQAAAQTGTAIEVNGSPRRLDLSGEMVRIAVGAGAAIAISSDAHSVAELDYVANALPMARRGWAEAVDVLNCRDVDALLAFAARKKERCS